MNVFVTGATGFVAKHVVLQFLQAGHRVTGSLRSESRADEVRDALRPELDDPAALDRLNFAVLDLTSDAGWDTALAGHDALIHTASPFPMAQPDNEDDIIRPAVDGARRALTAANAAGIKRVVLTSSIVAVVNTDLPQGRTLYDETDWTDLSDPRATAYVKSKTMAERAAWDMAESNGTALTTINPALVLGPPLDGKYGTSVNLVKRVMSGKDPMQPKVGFPVVDVRDVAAAHVAALDRPETAGKRYIAAEGFMWFRDIAQTLSAHLPDRKISTREAPALLLRVLSLFDKSLNTILPSLGERRHVSSDRARTELGIEFIDAKTALLASADFLVSQDSAKR